MASNDDTPPADVVPEETVPEGAAEREAPPDTTEERVTRGRAAGTPFVLLGGVALVIWAVVAVVAGLLLLLWWLG